jgi:hypothetical protein
VSRRFKTKAGKKGKGEVPVRASREKRREEKRREEKRKKEKKRRNRHYNHLPFKYKHLVSSDTAALKMGS